MCFACSNFGNISPADEAFILLSKEREHILDISEMSATSLEAKGSSDCVSSNERESSELIDR